MIFLSTISRLMQTLALVMVFMAGALAQNSNIAGRVTLTSGEHAEFDRTELHLTGSVHDQLGVALEHARVEARDFQSGTLLASAYTNGNGVFELTGLGQGLYEMVAVSGVNEARLAIEIQSPDTVVDIRIAISASSEQTTIA